MHGHGHGHGHTEEAAGEAQAPPRRAWRGARRHAWAAEGTYTAQIFLATQEVANCLAVAGWYTRSCASLRDQSTRASVVFEFVLGYSLSLWPLPAKKMRRPSFMFVLPTMPMRSLIVLPDGSLSLQLTTAMRTLWRWSLLLASW